MTGWSSQLAIRFACRSPAASERGTRITASASGSCSANSCMSIFVAGRKYGKTRKAPIATSDEGIAPSTWSTAAATDSHWSLATTTTGSVDPRWKRNPSPTVWKIDGSGGTDGRRATEWPSMLA